MMTRLFLNVANVGSEWVLWLLLALSFLSITVMIERVLYFRRQRLSGGGNAEDLEQLLHSGDVAAAWKLVEQSQAIECLVVAAGLSTLARGAQACSEAMLSAKARERVRLDSLLPVLGTIGSNAPFVGLLGTVLGIIKAAHDLSAAAADPNAVMTGVFEALVATAVGLFVAIPAVIAFNIFQRKVKTTIARVDSLAHLVLTNFRLDRKPAAGAPMAAAKT